MGKRIFGALVLFLSTHGMAWAQIADGTPFTIDWLYPNASTVYSTASKTVGAGAEVNCPANSGGGDTPTLCGPINGGPVTMDVSATSIAISTSSNAWAPTSFNGFRFTFPAASPAIAGVTLVTNDPGFAASNVQFTDHTVAINLQGRNGIYTYTLNLTFAAPPAVPVPTASTLALALMGLLLTAAVAWRVHGRARG